MARFLGMLPTDLDGKSMPELKAGVLSFTAEEMADLDANGILAEAETSETDPTELPTELVPFRAQPPCARQITVQVKSDDAGEVTAASTCVITGTNIAGETISETLTFTEDLSTALTTAKAFKTVTKIVFSKQTDGTPAFDVGWNEVIGLPFKFSEKPFVLEKFGGAMQFTAGTITVDADEIEKNVYDPNGNLDGTKELELLFFI